MSNQLPRYVLFAAIAGILFLLLREWTSFSDDYEAARQQQIVNAANKAALEGANGSANYTANYANNNGSSNTSIPTSEPGDLPAVAIDEATGQSVSNVIVDQQVISISTETQKILIDPVGGRITEIQLLKHLTTLDDDGVPLKLLESNAIRQYNAFDGIASRSGQRSEQVVFSAASNEFSLSGDQEQTVTLRGQFADGTKLIRRFYIVPNDYVVRSEITVENNGSEPWSGRYYGEIRRDNTEDPGTGNAPLGVRSYLGAATTNAESPYEKISFKDISKENYEQSNTGGWIAMIQHYFVSAWVPAAEQEQTIYTRLREVDGRALNIIGFIGRNQTVEPGANASFSASFYAGPKNQYRLGDLAEHLDLTVDYGFLWWLAQPLYALLHMFATGDLHIGDSVFHLFPGFNNWGMAIIALTFVVKALFFKLSAASYRSMANMRRVQPKLLELRERHASDRQALSKAMMDLYQKEKINPLGGCLPILIQMPVFIALYWALIESVELRHAPFALWIKDLSVMDPFFILPILMGVTMWFQTRMNPTPPDPMQAKIMQWMPIIFTFFFLWFPAGLVIYWVTNNILSISQQWYITRKIENEANAKT